MVAKKRITAITALGFLLVLFCGIAVFSLVKLYQLGAWPFEKKPAAEVSKAEKEPAEAKLPEVYQVTGDVCQLSFVVAPAPTCYQNDCTKSPNDNCPSGLECQDTTQGSRCVNPDCPSETDCTCPAPTCWQNNCTGPTGDYPCPSGLTCQTTSEGARCVNPDCPEDRDCVCDLACYQYTCSNAPNNCPSPWDCQSTTYGLRCVNPDCPEEEDCICPASFVCVDLTSDLPTVQLGSQVTFTCSHAAENVSFDHYDFRWSYDGGANFTVIDSNNTSGTSGPHTTTESGNYVVQCRACATTGSTPCTAWGQAGGWVE